MLLRNALLYMRNLFIFVILIMMVNLHFLLVLLVILNPLCKNGLQSLILMNCVVYIAPIMIVFLVCRISRKIGVLSETVEVFAQNYNSRIKRLQNRIYLFRVKSIRQIWIMLISYLRNCLALQFVILLQSIVLIHLETMVFTVGI